jgi:hypothetical protein
MAAARNKNAKLKATIAEDADAEGVTLNPEAWAKMTRLIDASVATQIKEHTDQTTKNFENVNLKLENIGKRIELVQGKYQAEIDAIKAKLDDPSLSVDEATGLKIKGLETQIEMYLHLRNEDRECDRLINLHHLCSAVRREQRQRSWSLRIYGFQPTWRVSCPNVREAYEDIVEPVLKSVIQSGDSVNFKTDFYSNIEYGHPLSPGRNGVCPPMIIRFYSRRTMFLFMLNKKEHLAALGKRAADRSQWANSAAAVKYNEKVKLRVSHDLADMNRQVMSFLHTAKLAHRCKTTNNGVSFMPVGYKGKWVRVFNPYASSVTGLITPLPNLNTLLSAKSIVLEAYEASVPNKELFDGLSINIEELIQVADQYNKKQPPEDVGGVDPGVAVRPGDESSGGIPPQGGAAAGADDFPALPPPSSQSDAPDESATATVAANTRAAAAAATASSSSAAPPQLHHSSTTAPPTASTK